MLLKKKSQYMDKYLLSSVQMIILSVRDMLSENGQQKILFIDGAKSKKVALLGDNLAELG